MNITYDTPLAKYTTFGVGGPADTLVVVDTYDEAKSALQESTRPVHLLGYGSNCLISDNGLRGTAIIWRGGNIEQEGTEIIAHAGVLWDDLVVYGIEHNLWGMELMSEIPSTVGGAVFGNIAAYGQQLSDTILWIEVYDTDANESYVLKKNDITFAYRQSSLQTESNLKIMRAAFQLSEHSTHTLKYDSALAIADELGLNPADINDRRKIIIETRKRAGSIYHYDDPRAERTAGSFFKNPLVTIEQATMLAAYDETGKTLDRILNQSKVHGGNVQRASAAHVLLAAGFSRGQTWGAVRLHPHHVLKIEALEGATAKDIYELSQLIVETVQKKLDITLEPEVKFLGEF